MIIGKIPGYNSETIKNANGISYTDRLLTNLTIAEFTPVGYSINLAGGWGGDLKNIGNKIYRLGSNISTMNDANNALIEKVNFDYVSTYTAMKQWHQMQKVAGEEERDFFKIICTNDSSITETLSNGYTDNILDKMAEGLQNKDSALGKLSKLATAGYQISASLDTNAAISMLGSWNSMTGTNQFMNLIASKMVGIQSAFPKVWRDSNYNNTSSFTIKLVSPSGHPDDIDAFIIKPLKHLILAASPITFDGIAYGYPPLWKVQAKGLVDMKLAAIITLSIARGGQDTVFNRYNQPTNIDVRIVVEPIVQGFATPLTMGLDDTADQYGGVKMIVQNPNSIMNPMLNKSIQDSSIELKPLNLLF